MAGNKKKIKEILVISQGFERGNLGSLSKFTINHFRGDKLPNFRESHNERFRQFCGSGNFIELKNLNPDPGVHGVILGG